MKTLELALLGSSRKGGEAAVVTPPRATAASAAVNGFASRTLCGLCLLLEQLIAIRFSKGAIVASGTDMVFLWQKFSLLLLASPVSSFILFHSEPPHSSCNLKPISLPNPHAKWYLLPPSSPFLLSLQYPLLQEWAYCPHDIFFRASHLPIQKSTFRLNWLLHAFLATSSPSLTHSSSTPPPPLFWLPLMQYIPWIFSPKSPPFSYFKFPFFFRSEKLLI